MNKVAVALLVLFALILSANAQKKTKPHPRNGTGPIGGGRVGTGAVSKNWKVAPNLDQMLAQLKTVRMPFDAARLSARERQIVEKLVEACNYLEAAFWRQSDSEALRLYQQLEGSKHPQDEKLRRLLFINVSRWHQVGGQPIVGSDRMPPGREFYPPGLTREQIEAYVKANPNKRAEIYSPYTVVRRNGAELEGIPYRIVYRPWLQRAAAALREAANLSTDGHFQNFLKLRADALLSDNYYTSDLAWLDLKDARIDLIFAPYETYLDEVLGVKTSYGAAILIRNDAESRKLALFEKYVPEIQDALPLPPEDRPSKKGLETPMEVVDSPFRTGDLEHGYQAVADNLPNDPRIHKEKGSKKIFFKNFMDARVSHIILPLAQRMMTPAQAKLVNGESYLAHTLMHEIAHGIGPAYARVEGKQVDIREAIGPAYSGLEEAKADVLGMFALMWMMDRGHLPAANRDSYYASYIADFFRTVRFGLGEAHSQAGMMEFNYLVDQKAITRDPVTGRYSIDTTAMAPAVNRLLKELLEQEATGDRARTEAWFKKYGAMPPDLEAALKKQSDVPVDIDPVFSFPVKVQ
ncbi:MAG: Zn-dependent hydrolase [Terriglobales bacterium]